MKNFLLPLIFVLCLTAFVFADPEYKVQPSVDFQVRDGIGNTLAKLKAGETVHIAYLGGSITAANGWRPKTTAWLQSAYPNAKVNEIHAAISGTGSYLGLFRLQRDVLQYDPDLLFVEFAVNDGGTPPASEWRKIQSIVRQTWEKNPRTDIVFVYTFCVPFTQTVQAGELPVSAGAQEMLADYYGIPSINFMKRVVELKNAGKLIFTPSDPVAYRPDGQDADESLVKKEANAPILWSNDGTHPLDIGHEMYLQDIQRAFAAMENLKPVTNRAEKLEKPFVEDFYQGARMIDITPEMLSGNWKKVGPNDRIAGFGQFLDSIWTTNEPGASLTFRFRGREAQIYDVVGPTAGQVRVTVDGKPQEKPLSRCDGYCVNYYSFRITSSFIVQGLDPNEEHTVTLELLPDEPDRAKMADGTRVKPEETQVEKYHGRNLWFGKILVF